jgi:hypothetical protein
MGSPSQNHLVLPAWRAGLQERTDVRQGKRGQDGELSVKQRAGLQERTDVRQAVIDGG